MQVNSSNGSLQQRFFCNRQNVLKPIDFVATLLAGEVKYQKLPSGNSEYIEFYDKNGEICRVVLMPKHSRK